MYCQRKKFRHFCFYYAIIFHFKWQLFATILNSSQLPVLLMNIPRQLWAIYYPLFQRWLWIWKASDPSDEWQHWTYCQPFIDDLKGKDSKIFWRLAQRFQTFRTIGSKFKPLLTVKANPLKRFMKFNPILYENMNFQLSNAFEAHFRPIIFISLKYIILSFLFIEIQNSNWKLLMRSIRSETQTVHYSQWVNH